MLPQYLLQLTNHLLHLHYTCLNILLEPSHEPTDLLNLIRGSNRVQSLRDGCVRLDAWTLPSIYLSPGAVCRRYVYSTWIPTRTCCQAVELLAQDNLSMCPAQATPPCAGHPRRRVRRISSNWWRAVKPVQVLLPVLLLLFFLAIWFVWTCDCI